MNPPPSSSPLRVLRPQPWDSVAVLVLWIVRRAFLPMVVLGIIPVAAAGQLDRDIAGDLDSPQELLSAVLSPLWLLAIAIGLRIATAIAGYAMAFYSPAADSGYPANPSKLTRWQRLTDQFTLASGRAALRRTWFVRYEAIHRLGPTGKTLRIVGIVVTWSLLPATLLGSLVLLNVTA